MPSLTTPIQHSIGSPSHINQTRKRNKRHPNWKGGNETVTVCRWHDSIHGKSYRLHQKTTRPNIGIWQKSRIQSQYSEIKGILVHQQWNTRNRNQEKNPIWYRNNKNKVPTQHWRKKLRKTQTNGSMYHAHGLEELTSSKWPY